MGLRLGGSLRLASKSDDTDFETYAPVSLDGYTLMGLRASLPLSSGFEIYGRVENLLNTRYETVSGYGSYGRAAYAGVRASF
jgi:vitamin B12 transporter